MKRLDLPFVLTVVAIVEAGYAIAGLLTPPALIPSVTGWMLNADGQWVAKLLGAALGSQAWVAWIMRKEPHAGVVTALAGYQIAASTIDWVMWLAMANQGIFSTPLARVTVAASIVLHYTLGALLLLALRRSTVRSFA
jgi:hypothetical protein